MPSGVTTLGDMAAQFPETIRVSCNRCERRGLLRTARLLAEYGEDFPGPALRRVLGADCPKMIEGKMHDVCGIHFPGLAGQQQRRRYTAMAGVRPRSTISPERAGFRE